MQRKEASIVNCPFSVGIACEEVVILKGGLIFCKKLSFIWRRSQYQRRTAYYVPVSPLRPLSREESLSFHTRAAFKIVAASLEARS